MKNEVLKNGFVLNSKIDKVSVSLWIASSAFALLFSFAMINWIGGCESWTETSDNCVTIKEFVTLHKDYSTEFNKNK